MFGWEDTSNFTSNWWNDVAIFRLNCKSVSHHFLWEYRIFHIFDVDHFTICNRVNFISYPFKGCFSLLNCCHLARKCFRNDFTWIKNVLDIRFQYVSFRSVDRLDTLSFHDKTHSAFSFPLFFCSDFFSVLNGYTKTSHTCVNVDDVSTSTKKVDNVNDLWACWACSSTCCCTISCRGIIILFIVTVTSWSRIIEFLNHEVSNEVHDKSKEDCYPYKVKDI